MLKSKMDGKTDTSYEWVETVRLAINALEKTTELEDKKDANEKRISEAIEDILINSKAKKKIARIVLC